MSQTQSTGATLSIAFQFLSVLFFLWLWTQAKNPETIYDKHT